MKTKEELDILKEEVDAVNKKLNELNEEELAQVSGGVNNVKTTDVDLCVGATEGVMTNSGDGAQIGTAKATDMLVTPIDK